MAFFRLALGAKSYGEWDMSFVPFTDLICLLRDFENKTAFPVIRKQTIVSFVSRLQSGHPTMPFVSYSSFSSQIHGLTVADVLRDS